MTVRKIRAKVNELSFYLSVGFPFLLVFYVMNGQKVEAPHKQQSLKPIDFLNQQAQGAAFGQSLNNHDIFANFDLKNGYNLPTAQRSSLNNNEMEFVAQQGGNHSNILLVTQWRAAGTFLGNLFNYHPDVFYLYEPQTIGERRISKYGTQQIFRFKHQIYREFFNSCNIPRYNRYKSVDIDDWLSKNKVDCKWSNMCFREKSTVLQRPPICEEFLVKDGRKAEFYDKTCPLNEIKLQQAENICRTKKARVAKSNLQSLKEIPPEFLMLGRFEMAPERAL